MTQTAHKLLATLLVNELGEVDLKREYEWAANQLANRLQSLFTADAIRRATRRACDGYESAVLE